jgi:hypothetical protein
MNTERLMAADRWISPAASDLEDAPRLLRDGRPLSVLIVDDDLLVGRILSEAVEEYGGRVSQASHSS